MKRLFIVLSLFLFVACGSDDSGSTHVIYVVKGPGTNSANITLLDAPGSPLTIEAVSLSRDFMHETLNFSEGDIITLSASNVYDFGTLIGVIRLDGRERARHTANSANGEFDFEMKYVISDGLLIEVVDEEEDDD